MRWLVFLLTLGVFNVSLAATAYPRYCRPILPIKQELVVKPQDKQAVVVLINNVHDKNLWLTHPVAEPSASAGWTTRIQPKNWSAIIVKGSAFNIACIEQSPGQEQRIACAHTLRACRMTKADLSSLDAGTYWLAEDKSRREILAAIEERGIKLKEAPAEE